MENGEWRMGKENENEKMKNGQWKMDNRKWTMDNGQWEKEMKK